jgi:glycosyltransferase involved in cell wall biosynthesis
MACGTPVITTRAGALPEIAGEAGWILDDPLDATALSTAIDKLLHDKGLRTRMIQQGFEHAAAFSWTESARNLLGVYKSVLES